MEAWFFSSEKMTATRQQLGERGQRRVVGDVGGGEQKRGFLAVQIGKLGLQLDVIVRGAGDVARTARARAHRIDGLVHGGDDGGVLAHAEVIVGAPDGDGTRAGAGEMLRRRERAAASLQICKNAIAPFTMNGVQGVFELASIVHQASSTPQRTLGSLVFFLRLIPLSLSIHPTAFASNDVYCRAAPRGRAPH